VIEAVARLNRVAQGVVRADDVGPLQRDEKRALYRCRRRARGTYCELGPRCRKVPAARPDTAEVREWVKAQGMEVKDRGRIPADLAARFNAATGK
jgi:hypothetical protein